MHSDRTYLFYDIETTGLDHCFDQILQYASIRTDINFNIIEKYDTYVKIRNDVTYSPHALLATKISPYLTLDKGISEYDAIKKIHDQVNFPGTISIGYNSINFDDLFLRFSFYRNILQPYTHQYAKGCLRMDLLPITILYRYFRESIIKWPLGNLKLENINKLNNFVEDRSHNAAVDVEVTLELAKFLSRDEK